MDKRYFSLFTLGQLDLKGVHPQTVIHQNQSVLDFAMTVEPSLLARCPIDEVNSPAKQNWRAPNLELVI